MDLLFTETVIIKFLFHDPELRDRTINYLTPEIFDDYNNSVIITAVKKFFEEFEQFPSLNEMKLELPSEEAYNRLVEILNVDLSTYSKEYLLKNCENFIKQKLTIIHFAECSSKLKEEKYDEATPFTDKIRESLGFSFNTALGLDFLEDEERIYNFLHKKDNIVPFGINFIDDNTKGGAHEKSLSFFLAETNLGKTLILCSCAASNIQRNKKVLYITCEMAEDKISERVLANIWDHNINELDKVNKEFFHNRFVEMRNQIKGNLQIKEYPPSTINPNHIRNLLKEYEIKKKFKPDIIYLDYLELVKPIYMRKADNSYSECKRVAEEVRAIAVDYAIPVVSALQTNRDGFGSAEITLKNTADSVGLAFTGDLVIAVTQPEELVAVNQFSLKFLKNRYGVNKIKSKVGVDKTVMRITNIDSEREQAQTMTQNLNRARPGTATIPTTQRSNATSEEIRDALEIMNNTFNDAHKSANESIFGDWE